MKDGRPDYCPESPGDPCEACGATLSGKDPVGGACQARYSGRDPRSSASLLDFVLEDKDTKEIIALVKVL